MNVSDFCITTHIVQYHATTFVMISFVHLLQKFLCIVLNSTHHGLQLGPFASVQFLDFYVYWVHINIFLLEFFKCNLYFEAHLSCKHQIIWYQ